MTDPALATAKRKISLRLLTGVLLALTAGALAAIAADGQDTAGSKATGTLRLVVEFNRMADARHDLRPRGDSVGDQVTYSDPVFDERNRRRIGRAMFLNTFQEASHVLVAGAIRLRDGTITLAGTLRNGAPDIAVTGGTGAYAGARGTYVQGEKEIEPIRGDGPGRYPATIVFAP